MFELICNLHIHSTYSDGSSNYGQILEAVAKADLDLVIITDHNILVKGVERYLTIGLKRILLLTGEEVHDAGRIPQKNHVLVLGINSELSQYAYNPQTLIDHVNLEGGLSFLAHPFEKALPLFHQDEISWESWEVKGFTGIELWNGFSELKAVAQTLPQVLYYAFRPELIPHGPPLETLKKWDELLCKGQHVHAVGGSDSHALDKKYGFIQKTIFPYEYHFSTINTHILTDRQLTGDIENDRVMIYAAIRRGSMFVANDLPASTRGFSFTAENDEYIVSMGEEIITNRGATLRIKLPQSADIILVHNGETIEEALNTTRLVRTITEPGYYRVEAWIPFRGKRRGWIFSNPIYLSKA